MNNQIISLNSDLIIQPPLATFGMIGGNVIGDVVSNLIGLYGESQQGVCE